MSFNTITHPTTGVRYSIFSSPGRELLKSYLKTYKSGGYVCRRWPLTPGCSHLQNKMDALYDKAGNADDEMNYKLAKELRKKADNVGLKLTECRADCESKSPGDDDGE